MTKLNSHSQQVDIITGATASSTPPIEEVIFEDGILCLILSFLTLKEAVRTSVLSRRWRRLWPRLTEFDFNSITVLDAQSLRGRHLDGDEAYKLTKGKTAKFIRSVDSVLQQLQGTQLDDFRVGHFFDKSHSHHLDAWLCFAAASKAKMLRMHLFKPYTKWYDFPCHLLGSSPFLQLFSLINCSFRLPCNFDGLSHLQKLILVEVDVTQEDFEHILSNCSSTLTKLVLWDMPQLISITSPCPLSQLEILLVENCCQLTKIDIRAINLLQVDYEGIPVDFKFKQSPKLNRAHIFLKTEGSMHNLNVYLTKLSSSLCHLESLTLKISGVSQVADLPKVSSRFAYLTHLDWDWTSGFKMSLFHLDTLLDVAPSLKELNLCDGILCLILSFLTLREAVRTSVLSRRWRRLWPRLTKFDFNAITVLDAQSLRGRHLDGDEAYNLTKGKTTKFIRSVDSVLQQLQGTQLDVLKVTDLPKVLSRFAYLTHLDWAWTSGFKMSLFHLDTLLDVAPSLKELNLCLSERVLEQPPRAPSKFREMLHKHPRCHLKTVRLRNFYFDTWQIEIAAYLLNKAIQLESMTIEKGSKPSSFASKAVFNRGKEILTQQVPENVRLIIL